MNSHDPALARAKARARLRRGMFLLPSLFTAGNIGAGYFSITQTIEAISQRCADPPGLGGNRDPLRDTLRRPGRSHRPHDEYMQRLWQGTGFAGGRDHVRGGAQPAGVCVGFSFSARFDQSATAPSSCAGRRVPLFPLHDWRGHRGWRDSTSATMRNRAIRDGRTASTLSECRFQRRRDFWRLRFTSSGEFPCRPGGLQFRG